MLVAAVAVGVLLGSGTGQPPAGQEVAGQTAAGKYATADPAHVRRGPRGRRGKRGRRGRPGRRGPVGPSGGDVITDLTINWRNGAWAGRDSAEAMLSGAGKLSATCRPIDGDENGYHRLILTPAANGVRTVVNLSTVQASDVLTARHTSESASSPISFELPINGMITAVVSVEPVGGDGGSGPPPWSLQASSEMKMNGPGGAGSGENFCYVALQAARGE